MPSEAARGSASLSRARRRCRGYGAWPSSDPHPRAGHSCLPPLYLALPRRYAFHAPLSYFPPYSSHPRPPSPPPVYSPDSCLLTPDSFPSELNIRLDCTPSSHNYSTARHNPCSTAPSAWRSACSPASACGRVRAHYYNHPGTVPVRTKTHPPANQRPA